MNHQEIQSTLEKMKQVLPTFQIPSLKKQDGTEMSAEEKKDTLAIYIMAFGGLNYQITIKALNNIMFDDSKMKEFRQAPIPTLARESTQLTLFTEEEKKRHLENQEIIYSVNTWHCIMEACNKHTGKRIPEKDRPFTALEEDYYKNGLMRRDEYWYWKDKEAGIETSKPTHMIYNPKTRKNDYDPILSDFEPIGASK